MIKIVYGTDHSYMVIGKLVKGTQLNNVWSNLICPYHWDILTYEIVGRRKYFTEIPREIIEF